MATDEMILTAEGRKKLEDELYEREHVRRNEINEQLREARGFGDLSENAEYDAAREAQGQNEARISEIEHILRTAKDAEQIVVGEHGIEAAVGTLVVLEDDRGRQQTYALTGTTETDSLNHRISNESPIGAALIGHVAGERISFVTPSGKVREYLLADVKLP